MIVKEYISKFPLSVLEKEYSFKLDDCGVFETNQWKRLFFCAACCEYFAFNKKASVFVRYVIKELVHTFSCAYIELWMHLGSLGSTQEARVALGAYASLVLSKLAACIHNSIYSRQV